MKRAFSYITTSRHEISDVLPLLNVKKGGTHVFDGLKVKTYSYKYGCWKNSVKCYWCRRKGEFLLLQQQKHLFDLGIRNLFHFNMYAKYKNKVYITFTKGPIIPSGPKAPWNLTTTCNMCLGKEKLPWWSKIIGERLTIKIITKIIKK